LAACGEFSSIDFNKTDIVSARLQTDIAEFFRVERDRPLI